MKLNPSQYHRSKNESPKDPTVETATWDPLKEARASIAAGQWEFQHLANYRMPVSFESQANLTVVKKD